MNYINAKFESIGFVCLLKIKEKIVTRFVLEFYSQLNFNYSCESHLVVNFVEISFFSKGCYQTTPPTPSVVKTLIQVPRQVQVTRVSNKKTINVDDNEILNHEIQHHMSPLVEIIRKNVLCLGGHRDHVSAFFILKRMESIQNISMAILPYGMLLTRLFTHVVSIFLELSKDCYILCNHDMHSHFRLYERKTRLDHGTKRSRSSNPSSSSNVLNHPSSSRHIDENAYENDEESLHSNTLSPSQIVHFMSNTIPRIFENPPHENQTLHSYQIEILKHQSQIRDEHRKGLRSIGKALMNVMKKKK
ncbi:hypothetical protein Tco_1265744 [Tanacetum coccineum]